MIIPTFMMHVANVDDATPLLLVLLLPIDDPILLHRCS